MSQHITIIEHRTAGPMLSVYLGDRHLGLIFFSEGKPLPYRSCPGYPLCDSRRDASFETRDAALDWLRGGEVSA